MAEQESPPAPALKTSVLIVSLNCEPALRRCLEALRASEERESFETLVVDCGSTDGSEQIDADFPEVTVLRLPRNFGRTKARNIGARTAKGEFLLLLEPDVLVGPRTIPGMTRKLEAETAAVAVAPVLVNPDGNVVSRCGPLPDPAQLYHAWASGRPWQEATFETLQPDTGTVAADCPDPGAVLVRAKAVKGMNYFDERFGQFGSDLDFCTQAFRASRNVLVAGEVQAVCRRGEDLWQPESPGAITTLSADYASGIIAYTEKYFGWFAGFRVRLRLILRALVRFQVGLVTQILNGQKIDGSQK